MFRSFLRVWLIAWLAIAIPTAWPQAPFFAIGHAQTRLVDKVYRLDAQLTYDLSPEAKKALRSGVRLTLVLDIAVYRKRWYLWDARIADLTQRYQLKYHMLTKRFVVQSLNTAVRKTYPTLESALNALEKLKNYPLLDAQLVDDREVYTVTLQTYLDIEALPAPLRPVAYFSPEWRLSSERFLCLLTP